MKGEFLYKGKAKTVYRTDRKGELIVEFRDDITAFDGEKKDILFGKGSYNLAVSSFFFQYLEKHGVKTHFIKTVDSNTMLVKALEMIPLEVIVRNIAAGSIIRKYPFREGQRLNPPIVVMDYKDDARHDPMVNDDVIIALGILNSEELKRIRECSLEINRLLKEYFENIGILLVDFKIEFGRFENEIILGDEISMDSMRLWDAATGESLDKDVYRYNKGDVLEAYSIVTKRILPASEMKL